MVDTYVYQVSSETLMSTYHNIRRHTPGDRDINKPNFRFGNLRSHSKIYVLQSPVETDLVFVHKAHEITQRGEIASFYMLLPRI
jgi:hypothetical protein